MQMCVVILWVGRGFFPPLPSYGKHLNWIWGLKKLKSDVLAFSCYFGFVSYWSWSFTTHTTNYPPNSSFWGGQRTGNQGHLIPSKKCKTAQHTYKRQKKKSPITKCNVYYVIDRHMGLHFILKDFMVWLFFFFLITGLISEKCQWDHCFVKMKD